MIILILYSIHQDKTNQVSGHITPVQSYSEHFLQGYIILSAHELSYYEGGILLLFFLQFVQLQCESFFVVHSIRQCEINSVSGYTVSFKSYDEHHFARAHCVIGI